MPMPQQGRNVLSNSAAADFRKMQKKVLGGQPPQGDYGGGGHETGRTWYWAKTTGSISAGTLASPTTVTFNVWLPDPSSSYTPRPFIVATDPDLLGMTAVNRSSMTGSSGVMIKVEYAFGEWSIRWADC
jgi:hypothetical protein